jgi:hypothetical protein
MRSTARLLRAAAGAAVALAVAAPAAGAACPQRSFSPAFSPWDDLAAYTLADNGDFEAGIAGWTTTGSAKLVADNPHKIAEQTGDFTALELAPGASATSPPICVGSGYPSARMFGYTTKRTAETGSSLQVEVLYTDATRGGQASKKLGSAPDELGWDATRKMSLAQGQLNIKPESNGNTYIRYRFTPLYKATWRIDDLYIDPRFKG